MKFKKYRPQQELVAVCLTANWTGHWWDFRERKTPALPANCTFYYYQVHKHRPDDTQHRRRTGTGRVREQYTRRVYWHIFRRENDLLDGPAIWRTISIWDLRVAVVFCRAGLLPFVIVTLRRFGQGAHFDSFFRNFWNSPILLFISAWSG